MRSVFYLRLALELAKLRGVFDFQLCRLSQGNFRRWVCHVGFGGFVYESEQFWHMGPRLLVSFWFVSCNTFAPVRANMRIMNGGSFGYLLD